MGFPKVLARRLRYTKGTKFYYYRDYAAFVGVLLASAFGVAFRYSDYIQNFRRDYEAGLYNNDPEFERTKLTMSLGPFAITSSKDILEKREEVKNFVENIRTGDLK